MNSLVGPKKHTWPGTVSNTHITGDSIPWYFFSRFQGQKRTKIWSQATPLASEAAKGSDQTDWWCGSAWPRGDAMPSCWSTEPKNPATLPQIPAWGIFSEGRWSLSGRREKQIESGKGTGNLKIIPQKADLSHGGVWGGRGAPDQLIRLFPSRWWLASARSTVSWIAQGLETRSEGKPTLWQSVT